MADVKEVGVLFGHVDGQTDLARQEGALGAQFAQHRGVHPVALNIALLNLTELLSDRAESGC